MTKEPSPTHHFKFTPRCRYRFLRPLLTASVLPWHARRLLRRVLPRNGRYSFPLWLFSCRCDSPYEAGRRPGVSVFLAAARSAVPICRPGHQYRGQNKSRFRLDAAHIVPKNKMRRFQDEISGSWAVFRPLQQEIARRCKYTIAVFPRVIQFF